MIERQRIAAASGVGLRLQRGRCLRVVDSEGGQSGDPVAYSADGRERLSNGRSFDYGGSLRLSAGAVLWSDLSRPMLRIVEDDVGRTISCTRPAARRCTECSTARSAIAPTVTTTCAPACVRSD